MKGADSIRIYGTDFTHAAGTRKRSRGENQIQKTGEKTQS